MLRLLLVVIFPIVALAAEPKTDAVAETQSAAEATPAAEAQPAASNAPRERWFFRNRSKYDSLLWVGGEVGIVFNGGQLGGASGLNLKLKFGRCGILGSWQTQKIKVWDPANVRNSILGLGTTCTIYKAPDFLKGLRGMHLAGTFLVERGETTYHVYEDVSWTQERETQAGSETAWGAKLGIDLFTPLVYGLWLKTGFGREYLNFKYDLSKVPGNKTDISKENNYIYLGLLYAI